MRILEQTVSYTMSRDSRTFAYISTITGCKLTIEVKRGKLVIVQDSCFYYTIYTELLKIVKSKNNYNQSHHYNCHHQQQICLI